MGIKKVKKKRIQSEIYIENNNNRYQYKTRHKKQNGKPQEQCWNVEYKKTMSSIFWGKYNFNPQCCK